MRLLALNLESEAPKGVKMSAWPWVDVCLIGVFATLFGSNYVIAPGIGVELPRSSHVQAVLSDRLEVMSVNEVGGKEQIIFEDRILNLETLRKLLKQRGVAPGGVALLVRADARVSAQTLTSIFEIAEEAGFDQVQLATESRAAERDPLLRSD